MKKLIAAACIAAGALLPASPASAGEPNPPPAGVDECPPGYVGYVVWAWNEKRGYYEVVAYCIPYGP